jgi:hypothetical protein
MLFLWLSTLFVAQHLLQFEVLLALVVVVMVVF